MKQKHEMSNEFLSAFFMELSLLLHAGIGVGEGMRLLLEEDLDAPTRGLMTAAAEELDRGVPLAESLRKTEKFPDYAVGMVEVGERTGRLEEALHALAEYYESMNRLDKQIRSALVYPAVLLILMLVVMVVLLTKVLPVFNEVFSSLGGEMTGVAGGLLALGRGLNAAMPLLCVGLGVAAGALALFAGSAGVRSGILQWWSAHRGDSGLTRWVADAHFAQAMAMGMQAGLAAEDSIRMTGLLQTDQSAAARRIQQGVSKVDQGCGLAEALQESGLLPPAACRLLALGIRGGTGDTVMEEIARRLQEECRMKIEDRVARVEPTLVIVSSVLVGVILMTVMMPLMNILSTIG